MPLTSFYNARFLYDNILWHPGLAYSVSSEDADYPASNLLDPRRTRRWRTTGLGTVDDPEWLLLGSANLVENGSFETGDLTGWTEQTGTWRVVQEGDTSDGGAFTFPAAGSGTYFAYPHLTAPAVGAELHELRQNVDVSAYAADIDDGLIDFTFRSLVLYGAGAGAPDYFDNARVIVEYRDASSVLDSYDTGWLQLGFTGSSGWVPVIDTRTAPVGTRTIRIRLQSEFAGLNGQLSLDGWHDAVALTINDPFTGVLTDLYITSHNLTEDAVVHLQCDDNGDFDSPEIDITIPAPILQLTAKYYVGHKFKTFFYRSLTDLFRNFIRITFADPTNAAAYLEFGIIWPGYGYDLERNFKHPWQRGLATQIKATAIGGGRSAMTRNADLVETRNKPVEVITYNDRVMLQRHADRYGTGRSFFVHFIQNYLDRDDHDTEELYSSALYGKLMQIPAFREVNPNFYQCDPLQFREDAE